MGITSSEADLVAAHLLRLDGPSLRARFGGHVSGDVLRRHAALAGTPGTVIAGAFRDGDLRAIGELRMVWPADETKAEAAISVERPYQDRGIGSDLMACLIEEARRLRVAEVVVCCEAPNRRMQRIVGKFGGALSFGEGDWIGRIAVTPRLPG